MGYKMYICLSLFILILLYNYFKSSIDFEYYSDGSGVPDFSDRAAGCGSQCPTIAPLSRDPQAANLLNRLVDEPIQPLFSCTNNVAK